MKLYPFFQLRDTNMLWPALSISITLLLASYSIAQETARDQQLGNESVGESVHSDASLTHQLHQLQTKVAELEATLKQNHQMSSPSAQDASMQSMGMMKGKQMGMNSMQSDPGMGMGMGGMGQGMSGMGEGGMGMMSGMNSMQSGQSTGGMGMGGMGMGAMGMMGGEGMAMMGRMPSMGQMQMPSALPGFPGASHIYHVGSTNFFLDHMQHIALSQEQKTRLNQIKQQTLLSQATYDRWIAEAEQELWRLTSADAPNAAEIEAKIHEVEKLRSDKRIAFIRAVGEAAQLLTNEQRQALVGSLPPDHTTPGGSTIKQNGGSD